MNRIWINATCLESAGMAQLGCSLLLLQHHHQTMLVVVCRAQVSCNTDAQLHDRKFGAFLKRKRRVICVVWKRCQQNQGKLPSWCLYQCWTADRSEPVVLQQKWRVDDCITHRSVLSRLKDKSRTLLGRYLLNCKRFCIKSSRFLCFVFSFFWVSIWCLKHCLAWVLHCGHNLMIKLYLGSVKMWEAGERKSHLINTYLLVQKHTSSSMRLGLSFCFITNKARRMLRQAS